MLKVPFVSKSPSLFAGSVASHYRRIVQVLKAILEMAQSCWAVFTSRCTKTKHDMIVVLFLHPHSQQMACPYGALGSHLLLRWISLLLFEHRISIAIDEVIGAALTSPIVIDKHALHAHV